MSLEVHLVMVSIRALPRRVDRREHRIALILVHLLVGLVYITLSEAIHSRIVLLELLSSLLFLFIVIVRLHIVLLLSSLSHLALPLIVSQS